MIDNVRRFHFTETVLPPSPWTASGAQIFAGDTLVATISCRNAEAVAHEIVEIVNRVGEVDVLHHEMRILRREIATLEDQKFESNL